MTTTLDWYGCATFAMKTAGMTIMLDAYIDRVPSAAGPRHANGHMYTADDVVECDWIVVGHSHFDHLWGAERILANTNATLIANYESVRLMEEAGVPVDRMICVAGGETIDLGNDVTVDVYPSQHSCVWTQAQMEQSDVVCIGDLGVTWQEQQAKISELYEWFQTLGEETVAHLLASTPGHSSRGDGGALVFVFDTPDGSIFFQDTSGHWSGILRDLRPDVALLGAAGRGNVDGEPVQGSLAEFVGRQVDLLGPKKVVLTHHDRWMPGFSIETDIEPIRHELARVSPGTELVELDYLDTTTILGEYR
jgi:L-ascorbate metabolism protein UlaG (beta-lactamase superfamily)